MRERIRVSGLAIASAVVFFLIATALGANLSVRTGPDSDASEMGVVHVLFLTIVAAALAIGLAWFLDRFSHGRTIWTVTAAVVFLGSFTIPAQLDLETSDLVWQAVLHSVFSLLLIVGFYVGWPIGPPRPENVLGR